MGTDSADAAGTVTNTRSFKVHRLMCTELLNLLGGVLRVLPNIEAARPRCASGIQALCLLNKAIDKAKLILQYCSESSKLYLALTGDVILSRCKKSRNLLEQSLCQIQDMVPVMLAAEISKMVDDLSSAMFHLDPYEEAAGKVIRELLLIDSSASESMEASHLKSFQLATTMLHITSSKTILLERRAIAALLAKVNENDPKKKKILNFFLYLFKKHGSSIIVDQSDIVPGGCEAEPRTRQLQYEMENYMLRRAVPPEEFRCPMSSRLMFDPVVIASGQTYERMWIQKWFDENNVTCPKTGVRLLNYSMTPNCSMKELISEWCTHNGVTIPNPNLQAETHKSWDTSCTSIASFGSSMNDLYLPLDFSTVSIGSIDNSFSSDYPSSNAGNGAHSVQNDCSSNKFQTYADLEFLSNLGELSWKSRCKVVEDVRNTLMCDDRPCYYSLTAENFVEPLFAFLREARDLNDVAAQRDGFELLLKFASKSRNGIPYLHEDAFNLIVSFLDSEVTKEAFAVIETLSGNPHCRPKIAASGALVPILRALDSQSLKILHNLSSDSELCAQLVSSGCVPKLVPLLSSEDSSSLESLTVVKNLCSTEEGRASVADTQGCIAAIVEALDFGAPEAKELAVDILLLMCSQRVEYCFLVMDKGVVPPLMSLAVNGNDRAKAAAQEMLRQLRDVRSEPERPAAVDVDPEAARGSGPSSPAPEKRLGFFARRKISVFGRKR